VATEAKPFASLSSGLLARKGAARPAMRPQGFGQGASGLEDLGWNDMGFEPPKPAAMPRDASHDAFGDDVVEHPRVHPTGLTPVHSPVHDQQAEIEERFAAVDEAAEAKVDDAAEVFEPEADEVCASETDNAAGPDDANAVEELAPLQAVLAPVREASTPVPQRRAPRARSVPGSKGKAAFTLRLDPDRHLRLRLACAVDGRSAQQLVTDALDNLLERMPDLDGLAEKAKNRG
jgi:hypothetical protein